MTYDTVPGYIGYCGIPPEITWKAVYRQDLRPYNIMVGGLKNWWGKGINEVVRTLHSNVGNLGGTFAASPRWIDAELQDWLTENSLMTLRPIEQGYQVTYTADGRTLADLLTQTAQYIYLHHNSNLNGQLPRPELLKPYSVSFREP